MKKTLMASVAVAALMAAPVAIDQLANGNLDMSKAYAQQGGKGQGGQGGNGGERRGGQGAGGSGAHGQGGQGVDVGTSADEGEDGEDSDKPDWAGQGGGGNPNAGEADEDSDRPEWAGKGATKPGGGKPTTDKGDLYGDLYVILRDENGEPILKEITTEDGTIYVPQPLDADGNLIPLDDEGHPIDESLTQEVELSRLNVARSPEKVTDRALDEAVAALNAAEDVTTDAAGRLVVLIDGEWKTIDSPIENMALYLDLLDDGSIEGLTNPVVTSKFATLVDGKMTTDDLNSAAVLLAATADKFTTLTLDAVMYVNNLLGVNDPANGEYIDLTSVDYTRSTVYSGVTAEVLIDPDGDGTYNVQTVNIYDAVFDGTDASATAAAGYTQAVDDARAVINYIHEYEVPAASTN